MPETPDWFWNAVETEPESGEIEVDDCDINYLTWSGAGNPGLLFVHGHNAHAHWWDFIAPFFKDDFQTAALDLSGMGDSGHRDAYDSDTYAREIVAVADELAMPQDTSVVAHSFGGMMALRAFANNPERFKGLVLVDSGVRHPDEVRDRDREPQRLAQAKVYPDREVAISRFRLQPPQQCENDYIVNHIARHSVEYDDGWVWKFDPEQGIRMNRSGDLEADLKGIAARVALIYGEQSESFSAKSAEYMKELQPALEVIPIADAQHHLFLDQPLSFIETLKSLLESWHA
ncbi:MAG: alpha/beta hydrolase [Pseudomonadales bacterium]|nr:alpha/beta hydrolase [Pseudomonadales bacterium]